MLRRDRNDELRSHLTQDCCHLIHRQTVQRSPSLRVGRRCRGLWTRGLLADTEQRRQWHDAAAIQATPFELREIVKDAYVYGFPMVDSYRIQYPYFVDQTNAEFKGVWRGKELFPKA